MTLQYGCRRRTIPRVKELIIGGSRHGIEITMLLRTCLPPHFPCSDETRNPESRRTASMAAQNQYILRNCRAVRPGEIELRRSVTDPVDWENPSDAGTGRKTDATMHVASNITATYDLSPRPMLHSQECGDARITTSSSVRTNRRGIYIYLFRVQSQSGQKVGVITTHQNRQPFMYDHNREFRYCGTQLLAQTGVWQPEGR